MTISRAEVITSVERRRRWSQDEKERLVAASLHLLSIPPLRAVLFDGRERCSVLGVILGEAL